MLQSAVHITVIVNGYGTVLLLVCYWITTFSYTVYIRHILLYHSIVVMVQQYYKNDFIW